MRVLQVRVSFSVQRIELDGADSMKGGASCTVECAVPYDIYIE